MSEVNEESSTAAIIDMLSVDCGWAADVLLERWAGLRSENQTLERQLALADKLLGEYSQFKRVKGSIEALHESYLALKEQE